MRHLEGCARDRRFGAERETLQSWKVSIAEAQYDVSLGMARTLEPKFTWKQLECGSHDLRLMTKSGGRMSRIDGNGYGEVMTKQPFVEKTPVRTRGTPLRSTSRQCKAKVKSQHFVNLGTNAFRIPGI